MDSFKQVGPDGITVLCPHCAVRFHARPNQHPLGKDSQGTWLLYSAQCEACKELICILAVGEWITKGRGGFVNPPTTHLVYPRKTHRPPPPPQVPRQFLEDYNEACLVLADSPKASAALSRRCLELLLTEKVGVKKGDLADKVRTVLRLQMFPPRIAKLLDVVREVGNFGAHAQKSLHTGEIMPVAMNESELNLESIEALFDYLFVQPAAWQARLAAINAKLEEAGRKPLQQPPDSEWLGTPEDMGEKV